MKLQGWRQIRDAASDRISKSRSYNDSKKLVRDKESQRSCRVHIIRGDMDKLFESRNKRNGNKKRSQARALDHLRGGFQLRDPSIEIICMAGPGQRSM